MKRELDERLCKIAPILFGDRCDNMQNTAMCWGFECGDGWFGLLADAATKLEPLCRKELIKYQKLEKFWYKYPRWIMQLIAKSRIPYIWNIGYRILSKIVPGVYHSPLYWYGGAPRALQVKEKYGTLRFYLTHGTDEMYAITDEAERQSVKTCETCGMPGKLRGKGWLYTRCTKCWKKENDNGY